MAVLASDPRFAAVELQDPNVIGQCCFYSVIQTGDTYVITIEIGWGDCPAGCIERHRWQYAVQPNGAIALQAEDGPPVPVGSPGGGGGSGTGTGTGEGGGASGIRGIATAGPTCPVVRPNDPACADRPVAGATIHVVDATGTEVATLETDAAGAFVVPLPPGRYHLAPDPVAGVMGTAAAVDVTVGVGHEAVQLQYDTGIR